MGFVDPYKMAKNGQTVQGKLALSSMLRANKMLAADTGDLTYELVFSSDAERACFVSGKLDAQLTVCCQRCLQNFALPLAHEFEVTVVNNDADAKLLINDYEPVVIEQGKLYPTELIEDELILALPLVPMHQELCVEYTKTEEQELRNPFQVLQKLNVKKKGQQAGDK